MNATRSIEFLQKWQNQHPFVCKWFKNHLANIEKDIEKRNLPPEMIADFHMAIAQDIYNHIADNENDNFVAIRFDQLPVKSEFWYQGKAYIKLNDIYNRSHTGNAQSMDTSQEKIFVMDDTCLILANQAKAIS